MAYATVSDTQTYLPPGYTIGSSAGVPSTAQVTEFLSLTSGEIDAALASRGLAVPVASPTWFVTECQRLNAQGAAALTLAQIFPLLLSQTPASTGSGSVSLGGQLMADYKKRLTELRQGIGVPVAVQTQETDLAPRSYLTDVNADQNWNGDVTDELGRPVYGQPVFFIGQVF